MAGRDEPVPYGRVPAARGTLRVVGATLVVARARQAAPGWRDGTSPSPTAVFPPLAVPCAS